VNTLLAAPCRLQTTGEVAAGDLFDRLAFVARIGCRDRRDAVVVGHRLAIERRRQIHATFALISEHDLLCIVFPEFRTGL
jgi:energy-converting hydrogenase Eha subunit H